MGIVVLAFTIPKEKQLQHAHLQNWKTISIHHKHLTESFGGTPCIEFKTITYERLRNSHCVGA